MTEETPGARRARILARAIEISAQRLAETTFHQRRSTATMTRASELCAEAWSAAYDASDASNRPNLQGSCLGKALWLRERLGGVVVTGEPVGGGDYHAVLILAIDGEFHVADAGQVIPLAEYQRSFRFDGGVYERGFHI